EIYTTRHTLSLHDALPISVILRRRAHTVNGSCLGLVRDAEESLQQTMVSKGMKHIQGVEVFPRPIFNATALGLFGQIGYGKVSGRRKQFVIVFISRGHPLRGPVREDLLQKCGAPPVIKIGIFSKERLEEEVDSRPARCVKKRN